MTTLFSIENYESHYLKYIMTAKNINKLVQMTRAAIENHKQKNKGKKSVGLVEQPDE